jgi:hypothetical protein
MGIPASEYVAGASAGGHVHVFSGGQMLEGGVNSQIGQQEMPPMAGAPASDRALWNTVDNLMPYDITLLSCEGGETYDANPPALEQYLNAGGRVFASHFHYAWFTGPLSSTQSYKAPTDWGNNLATWSTDTIDSNGPIGGVVVQTINGSLQPFPEGIVLQQWLQLTGALGKNGVPALDVSIYQPRYNAIVGPAHLASQPLITSDSADDAGPPGQTMQFSFGTPASAAWSDAGPPAYCGRAVFSDLHSTGDPSTIDRPPPPNGCVMGDLSAQEKAIEFTVFELSSCVSNR